jgi:hypothetical protein
MSGSARRARSVLLAVGWGVLGPQIAGCKPGEVARPDPRLAPSPAPRDLAARVAQRRALAGRSFARAALVKPAEDSPARAGLTLAPIFAFELPSGAGVPADGPLADWGKPITNALVESPARPVVYVHKQAAALAGDAYTQWVYHWGFGNTEQARPVPGWGWLRVTLDRDGLPVIWETLVAGADRPEVYVAEGLETAAAAQYGAATGGRVFAVEAERPNSVPVTLVRVLRDGPMAMGPFVYVDRVGRVRTVLCRCMSSQIREVVANDHYELRSLPHELPDTAAGAAGFPWAGIQPSAIDLDAIAQPDFVAQALRLPVGF